ncbi:MAG TPA: aldolase/citrate lyase family protein [Thermoanaerobaculales bacterium]|nr:aldolase/citrate lyase family protein [Thermoanaerobaculales bacterium]HPA81616.1 aldolase/citrate lyase family protein [Thermoanaerobaculales bacterium]HQL28624.1 aldolase/citrate lyase family protein [Thermoanaerobaculales bacterium]HQN96883.1 aldolase/citrate lyase family protein [Thermoanaerobaculales bacterium]HQP43486.1 aldolase/citrate lyase family protein [Thermoanaerobaculales bacterium]
MKKLTITEAAAGPLGEDVRSDAHVRYLAGAAPLEVAVASKVDYLYGDAIAAAARRVAEAFAVTSGRLEVTDQGALEWVLLARIEACLRRAGFPGGPVLPERAPGAEAPRQRERLRRSRLYIPGNRPKLMLSAGLYGADGLILDLEDSVPPPAKDEARLLVRNALVSLDWGGSERMVRINQGPLGDEDLAAIAPCNPHLILLPKVEEADQVRHVASRLRELLGGREVPFLMPILESPAGIFRAAEIAAADPSVVALTLGLEDLSAELGAPRSAEGWESFLARSTTVYAARAAGVQPIASVFSDIRDQQALAQYVRRERGLGFDGIGCIHPGQIEIVHREMTPSEAEAERAVRIVRAAREAGSKGLAAVAVGSKMVDPPVVRQAFRTVELAIAGGVLREDWETAG